MQTISAAIFDPQTGQVTATMMGTVDMLESVPAWVEIPAGVDLANLAAWSVDLETMELVVTDLEPIKSTATAAVNEVVGRARLRFITDIPGQEMIYTIKEQQARTYLAADPEPTDLSEFRMIATEVAVRGITPYEAAQLILNLSSIWQQVGGALEDIRLQAVMDIDAATTAEGIEVIRDGAVIQVQTLLSTYA